MLTVDRREYAHSPCRKKICGFRPTVIPCIDTFCLLSIYRVVIWKYIQKQYNCSNRHCRRSRTTMRDFFFFFYSSSEAVYSTFEPLASERCRAVDDVVVNWQAHKYVPQTHDIAAIFVDLQNLYGKRYQDESAPWAVRWAPSAPLLYMFSFTVHWLASLLDALG